MRCNWKKEGTHLLQVNPDIGLLSRCGNVTGSERLSTGSPTHVSSFEPRNRTIIWPTGCSDLALCACTAIGASNGTAGAPGIVIALWRPLLSSVRTLYVS